MTTPAPLATFHRAPRTQHPALTGCLEALRRLDALAALLEDVTADATIAEVGPHLRHALDHVSSLTAGVATGLVDYAARRRDPELERSPRRLRRALGRARIELETLAVQDPARSIQVADLLAPGRHDVVTSSLARELAFVSSHAIHHVATISLLLKARGIEIPRSVVLAYSTAAHEKGRDA